MHENEDRLVRLSGLSVADQSQTAKPDRDEGHWVNPQTESKLRWSELRCTKTLFKEICCEPVKSWPDTLLTKLLTEGCISKPAFGQGETTGTSSYLDCSLMRLITEEQSVFLT